MKRNYPILIAGFIAAGLLCGVMGRLLIGKIRAPAYAQIPSSSATRAAETVPPAAPTPEIRPTDTAETLLALDDSALYGRLALWLLDADEAAIAAFSTNYQHRENPDNQIRRLVFLQWTRLNPQAAVAAAGTADQRNAWQAWACNDPEHALAAANIAGRVEITHVIESIAQFHPKRLRAHFDQLSDQNKEIAISCMRGHAETSDPMVVMEFARKCGDDEMVGSAFRSLAKRDPFAAWEWLQQNSALAMKTLGGRDYATEFLFMGIKPAQLKDFEKIAAMTPPGALKREMEARLFDELVTNDSEAALAEAKATKAPLIAARRLAQAGVAFVHSNPEKAFEAAAAIFAVSPGAMDGPINVTFPGGTESWADESAQGIYRLLSGLSTKDPARTLEMVLPVIAEPTRSGTFSFLTATWAERDLVGYTRWVNLQADPRIREPAAHLVVTRLSVNQQYGEALEWAMSLSEPQNSRPESIYRSWSENDPQEAQNWLESANLSTEQKLLIEKGGAK